jgi:putative ABC transport system substrate-binding protein
MNGVRRRVAKTLIAFVILLAVGGLATDGQAQSKTPRVGVLALSETTVQWYESFIWGLAEHGWVPGQNVVVEYQFARGKDFSFSYGAEKLVQLEVDVIFAASAPATSAAHAATTTIPIVAADYTTDPVAAGYAKSYSRPGKNLTGVFLDAPEFAGKWIELLRAVVPELKRVVVLWDPAPGAAHLRAVQRAAQPFGLDLQVHEVHVPEDLETAFAAFRGRPQALIILPSPMTWANSARLAALALKARLPATSMARAFAEAGGSVSYGPVWAETMQRNAIQVAKILDGAKPGDLPIERPNKFNFVFNMKTIKALGLKVPESLLPGAEQVGR